MGVKRNTTNRLTLYRNCGTCGKSIKTSADSPWVRSIVQPDKRQVTTYYCSSPCFQASYKHIGWYDGKADERRRERDRKRTERRIASGELKERNRLYYEQNREKEKARAKARYWSDPEAAKAANEYQRKKRKAMQLSADQKGANENV